MKVYLSSPRVGSREGERVAMDEVGVLARLEDRCNNTGVENQVLSLDKIRS